MVPLKVQRTIRASTACDLQQSARGDFKSFVHSTTKKIKLKDYHTDRDIQ